MPLQPMPHRASPCQACPFVQTTPPGQFSAARYEALRYTSGSPGHEAPFGAPLFACHESKEGKDLPCAGWSASIGVYSITLRVLITQGRLPTSVLRPGRAWPALFTSYAAMAAVMGREGT